MPILEYEYDKSNVNEYKTDKSNVKKFKIQKPFSFYTSERNINMLVSIICWHGYVHIFDMLKVFSIFFE